MSKLFLTVAALAIALAAAATSPHGQYCGDFMGFVEGKVLFPAAPATRGNLTLTLSVSGDKTVCPNEPFTFDAAKSEVVLAGAKDHGNCIGKLLNDNDIPSLSVVYSAADDTVDLDVSIADVTLERC
jgi:hypothetical protein